MPGRVLQSHPEAQRRLHFPLPLVVQTMVASRVGARALEITGIVLLAVAGFWLAAYYLGQDAGWDLRNYHFYNPHALFHGRLFWDIQPAMRQTYFNPLIDAPFYLLAVSTSPLVTSLALAAFQSLTLVFAYFICRELLRGSGLPVGAQMFAALCIAGVGVLSPISVHEVGQTAGDNTSGVFILAALLCMLIWLRRAAAGEEEARPSPALVLAAGVLAGISVGLKPTNGVFGLALILAVPLLALRWREKFRATLWYGIGGLAGAGAAAGWWWWILYVELGNPLFPQFNHIFQSPYIGASAFGTTDSSLLTGRGGDWRRYLAKAAYPFYNNVLLSGRGAHVSMPMDLRLPVFYLASLAGAGALLWRKLRGGSAGTGGSRLPHLYLVLFLFLSYLIWLETFAIYRYALLIDVLVPVACFSVLTLIGLSERRTLAVTAALLLVFLLSYHEEPSARLSWRDSFFQVAVPAQAELEGALVVISGHDPVAYVIPYFPSSTRFVRIAGNLFYLRRYRSLETRYATGLGQKLSRVIEGHTGAVYAIFKEEAREEAETELAFFGLGLDPHDQGIPIAEYGTERPVLLFRAQRQEPVRSSAAAESALVRAYGN